MASDDSDIKPLGFSIDIGEILKDVAGTRKRAAPRRSRPTTSRSSSPDMDVAVKHAIRAELIGVERALKLLADEVVKLRRANEDLAARLAKLTRR